MIDLAIQLQGADRFQAQMQRGPAIVQEALHGWTDASLRILRDEVRSRTPIGRREDGEAHPHLRDSIGSVTTLRGTGSITGGLGVIGPAERYWLYVEDDTKPHIIRAKMRANGRQGRLRFRVGGRLVFAREVRHPGTTGRHMFRDGALAAAPRIHRSGTAYLGHISRRLGFR